MSPVSNSSPVSRQSCGSRNPGNHILNTFGDTPYSRLARLPFYRHDFLCDDTVVLPWIRRGYLAIALGEPVGPSRDLEPAVREFTVRRKSEGLKTAFVPIGPINHPVFRSAGFHMLPIGKSARLSLPNFELQGRKSRSLRHALNRGHRAGYSLDLVAPAEMDWGELQEVSDQWLSRKRLPELHFGVGWFDAALVLDSRVALVRNRFGRVEAFATLIEGYAPDETALDIMRYRHDAAPGTMEFLLTSLVRTLKDEGKHTLDLGLAPLAGYEETHGGRTLRKIFGLGKHLYNFEGLYAFKNKFRPRWENRYLALESAWTLPHILTGIGSPVVRSRN